jgi:hypothetical protein
MFIIAMLYAVAKLAWSRQSAHELDSRAATADPYMIDRISEMTSISTVD